MNTFYNRYADVILHVALDLHEDDILSINTEEDNVEFARLIAEKAKAITGNGSYLMILENGKEGEMTELYSDFKMTKSPTLFLHLQKYEELPSSFLEKENLSARDIQLYRHLSSPLFLPVPSIPFASVPVPSEYWGNLLDSDDGGERLLAVMISDLLGLNEEDHVRYNKDINDTIQYDEDNLNSHGEIICRLYDDEGSSDLSFSFAEKTRFASDRMRSQSGRVFFPALCASGYFRATDKRSGEGYVSSSLPFMLFGHIVNNITLFFEKGEIVRFETDEESAKYFEKFLSLDPDNRRIAEIVIAEENNRASGIPLFAYAEWDRMRTTGITLGSPRAESLLYEKEEDIERDKIGESLSNLFIPVGKSTTSIVTDEGEYILEDGIISVR